MAFTLTVAELIDADTSGLLGKHPTWERVPLSDVASMLNGAPFDSALFGTTEGLPLVRIRDVIAGETNTYYTGAYEDTYLVRQGELLVGMDGDFNSGFWGARTALLNQRVCKISPTEAFYDKRLLALALPGYLAAINANTPSVTVKHLSSKTIGEIGLPLPPRAEQTRIVAKLEELLSDLDAGVAELKAAQKKLGQYRQSLLKAAVEGALTAEWRKQQQAPLSPRGRGAGGEGENTPETDTWFRDRARELRKAQTPAEHDLWQQLRAKRFSGFKFRRQQVIGNYIVDFVCFDQKLVIELDGSQHAEAKERDESRDRWLSEQGFRVLRFWNNEWMAQAESVLETIWSALHEQPPLPNPSPTRGEGLNAPFSLDGLGGASETGAQLLARILTERRARWEAKQLAKFKEQGKTPPKDWQNKYPEPVQPDTTDLPALPEGWVWASVDCLLSHIETGKSFKCVERPPAVDETGVVKVSAVSWSEYNEQESKTCTNEERVNPALLVKTGDFLFSRANTVELVGACVIAKTVSLKVMLSDKILRLVLVRDDLKPWLLYLLRSKIGRKQIEVLSTGNQESMKNIGQERIRSIAIPIGSKDEIDCAIALVEQEFASAGRQISANEFALKQSTAQRQNILRAAFAGQLVPQDPNDEPASVLLERIRVERAKNIQSKPRRQRAFAKPKV